MRLLSNLTLFSALLLPVWASTVVAQDLSTVQNDAAWKSKKKSAFEFETDRGLLLNGAPKNADATLEYTDPISTASTGATFTAGIDFTYDQVSADHQEREIIRVGASNGSSQITAVIQRKRWGNYDGLGIKGYADAIVYHKKEAGFANNKATGTSDPLRLTLTLTRGEGELFDLAVFLKSLKPGSNFETRWDRKGVSFKKGSADQLHGLIQIGGNDRILGITNRRVTKFVVNNSPAPPKPESSWQQIDFKSYFLPMPPQGPMVKKGIWGASNVVPRDVKNGLEDADLSDWCYWDGSIVKGDQGKYHLYASRWSQEMPHGKGWKEDSKGVYAVSDNVFGPYEDKGLIYPQWQGGKGHNVCGLKMFDGRYAVVTSEITDGTVFVSDSPSGPFELLGEIKWKANGFPPGLAAYRGGRGNMSNVKIIPRPDGRYMIVPRTTAIMISEDGILGPYKIMTKRIFDDMPEIPKEQMEDPTCWYSGGMYHMLINHWPGKTTYYFSSEDGINDWRYRGIAYRKDESIFRYTNGKVEEWKVVERPTAYVEDGKISHFNFSVIDVGKGSDGPNDKNGSKIIVVPFDGERFEKDIQAIVAKEKAAAK